MKLPNWFKITWWFVLIGLTSIILSKRYYAISIGKSVPDDIYIFLIFVAVMLVPFFSEIEFFGIKFKKEIDALKQDFNVKISELKNEIRVKQEQNIHIYNKQKSEGGLHEIALETKMSLNNGNSEAKNSSRQKNIDLFFEYSSIIGLFALYAIHLSKTHNKPFNIKQLCSKISLLDEKYTSGFLIAASSFGLFSRKNYSDIWQIASIDKYFNSKIKEIVLKKAKEEKESEGSDYLYQEIKNIEFFFKF